MIESYLILMNNIKNNKKEVIKKMVENENKLKTCPVCNSWDIQVYSEYIYCNDCDKRIEMKNLMKNLIQLQEYNTRVQLQLEGPPKTMKYFKMFYEDMVKIHLGKEWR